MSLIEILVVVAIVGLLMGGATYGLRAVSKSRLRGGAGRLASAIRYCFDRSMATGQYYRLVVDLSAEGGGTAYWPEKSSVRAYVSRDKERSPGRGKAFDTVAEEKRIAALDKEKEAEATRKSSSQTSNIPGGLSIEPPPRPKRARFQTFDDAITQLGGSESQGKATIVRMKGIAAEVYTPRQPEPYTSGRAYLYFFPDGHTERALIRLRDGDDWYSLVVSPLTGRVEVSTGKLDLPRDFDTKDLTAK